MYCSREGAIPLFLAFGDEKKGQAKPSSAIQNGQLAIQMAYATLGQKAATSWADRAGADLQLICNAAAWTSDFMLARL